MALTLKNLAAGVLATASTDFKVYGYTASPPAKSALIKNIILTNTHATIAYTADVTIRVAGGTPGFHLSPVNVSIPPKGQVILDSEITLNLQSLDQIWINPNIGAIIEYVLNGLERDL